ncbi:MAG: single-stranded-DNA-specific exonuclease RecJ [Clostridia bacterium]|nr:single-stranded-DNA-specific exonuclease RecJ [Clostridia bacterium]
MKERTWELKQQDEAAVASLCRGLGVSRIIAQLLCNRGLTTPQKARDFLSKSIDSLCDPLLIPDMAKAVARIEQALSAGEGITIFGDYDVDGITSTSILYRALTKRGGRVDYYIPNRCEEGYGLSCAAIDRIAEGGTTLIITVDSGITAVDEVAYAKERGIDVVVTDHHECQEQLPEAVAVVNPKRADSRYPFKELAGVGVVFKLICAMMGRERLSEAIEEYSGLVAFGTIADVMPLTGENRIIVALGMRRIECSNNVGMRALISRTGIERRRISAGTVGFTLAPRVNAAGRVGCARRAVELFLSRDPLQADEIAAELCDCNRQRQEEENKILQRALEQIEEEGDFLHHNIIVQAGEEWHHGIIGIVCSRLCDQYYLPTIMISFDEEGLGKGSCRSIAGFNIYEALEKCSAHLEKFGGHALAAGLTVRRENYPAFRDAITKLADETIRPETLLPHLSIDCEIAASAITLDTVSDISYLEPYGMGNPAPVFLCRGLTVVDIYPLSGDKHLRLTLRQGHVTLTAFLFGRSSAQFEFLPGECIDICCNLDVNVFRGVQSVQVVIKDYRESEIQSARRAEGQRLYRVMTEGTMTGREALSVLPHKTDFVAVYRLFCQESRPATLKETARRLSTVKGGPMEHCRLRICLDVLSEMGIFRMEVEEERLSVEVNHIEGKVNLNNSVLLRRLRRLASEAKEG